ncbi:dehydrogenase [Pseudohalioglobus sediminis]|uniref:dehydrogenase n=1 Tax=Pseudohalioglobus sediminis TaxID=2606449 RepID=UPI00165EE020|nr:dehydrogenase [Pseudohalioglobus sediminis]
MKRVVSISLGPGDLDVSFRNRFLGETFAVTRIGTDKDQDRAATLVQEHRDRVDALGLGMVREHYTVGTDRFIQPATRKLEALAGQTSITTGARLREIVQEWTLRSAMLELGNIFNNAKVLFLSGTLNYRLASVLAEYTDNLTFADPVAQFGLPNLLHSLRALERYASGSHPILRLDGGKDRIPSVAPFTFFNHLVLRRAVRDAHVVVAPYEQLQHYGKRELEGKTVITSTVSDERLAELRDKGVRLVLDCSIQPFKHTVGLNVIDAMIIAALDKPATEISHDDYLEIFTDLELKPRLLYPTPGRKHINRFAFVIHPLSQQYLKHLKPLEMLSRVSPQPVMDLVEKAVAYTPPFVYSKVEGIRSPDGVEAEGWLIIVGGTPKEIMSHTPEFTYRRLLAAADIAKDLGAQIMGLGAFTKVVGDAGVTVAKRAPLPITTGNSYSASGALWAAHDAVQRLGLVKLEKGKKVQGKAMVVGATGAIGAACARLLARTAEELHLVSPEAAKLLILEKSILRESPGVKLVLSSYADSDASIGDMDMIVTATSGAGKKILDIMQVKPGCVITDVARPLDLSPEDVAKRPDVLVIESGEIALPGDINMKSIGFDDRNVVYACLAETIVLALEGRFENFTLGRNLEWEKVHEIYKLGLKHGMQLAAISGVNGVYSDADIAAVRKRALTARKQIASTDKASGKTSSRSGKSRKGKSQPGKSAARRSPAGKSRTTDSKRGKSAGRKGGASQSSTRSSSQRKSGTGASPKKASRGSRSGGKTR